MDNYSVLFVGKWSSIRCSTRTLYHIVISMQFCSHTRTRTMHNPLAIVCYTAAYHINDDRYDYMLDDPSPTASLHEQSSSILPKQQQEAPRFSVISSPMLQSTRFTPLPTEFAVIGRNDRNLLVVSWLNPLYNRYSVNLGAVMNRGAYCVCKYT